MRFPKNGVLHETAGFELIRHIKEELPNLPTVLQSSDPGNAKYAHSLKSNFINKNSESLLQDLKSFINYYLGFGHFVYRDTKGRQIAVAKSMKEFEAYLQTDSRRFARVPFNEKSFLPVADGQGRSEDCKNDKPDRSI